jgi:hypothetical protein
MQKHYNEFRGEIVSTNSRIVDHAGIHYYEAVVLIPLRSLPVEPSMKPSGGSMEPSKHREIEAENLQALKGYRISKEKLMEQNKRILNIHTGSVILLQE